MNFDGRLDLSLPHRRLCRCHGMAMGNGAQPAGAGGVSIFGL